MEGRSIWKGEIKGYMERGGRRGGAMLINRIGRDNDMFVFVTFSPFVIYLWLPLVLI